MQKSNRRPLLISDKELIKKFFLLYIGNLYQTEEESNNNTNRTQKNNNKSANANKSKQNNKNTTLKYNNYIQLISEIYETTQDSLFRKLYDTTITYRDLVDEIHDTAKDFYYINTHGGFTGDMKPKLIPEKTVLIFLTPVNRYGITCNLSELSSIKDNLKKKDNRLLIQKNLPCLDKFNNNNTNNKVNTRYVDNYYKMFKNATILYSGQYYYDLELGFTKEDNGKDLNINYFTGDSASQDLIKKDTNYYDILSNIVDRKFNEVEYNNHLLHNSNNGIRYIIVNCCRNIDYDTRLSEAFGKNIYIYENFMFYYNLIMENCIYITTSTLLPDTRFASYAGIAKYFSHHITEQQWDTYKSTLQGNFYKYISKPEIIENITKLLSALLPDIDKVLNDSRLNISDILDMLDYNNGNIKISTDYIFDFLNSCYNKNKTEKPHFLKYVNCNNIRFLQNITNNLYNMLLKAGSHELINRDQLEAFKDMINKMLNDLATIVANPDKIKLITDTFTPYIDAIDECLDTNEGTEIDLETNCKKLYKLMINYNFTYELKNKCDILFPGMKKKYDEMLSELKTLVDTFLKDPKNILSDKLANIKNRGNSNLGNKGRNTLRKTYFKKTNKNTKLSPTIQELIESESIKVISQLNLKGLENQINV